TIEALKYMKENNIDYSKVIVHAPYIINLGNARDLEKRKFSVHFLEEELNKNTVVANLATTASDNKVYQVDYYNLDVIISVGYRVKSKEGTQFRIWANKVLKDYMLKGYAINQTRLDYLEKTVKLIDIASRINNEAKEILNVINEYSKALNLLDDYDHKAFNKIKGRDINKQITYKSCLEIIEKLKFNNDSDLFALERNNGLESIINNIYLSYDNKDVYPTIEEKSANFLYLIVKNHSFIDGNKRIAATLFIYFLQFYDILYINNQQIIDNNTLVALTLLIAESNSSEKSIIIDLIINLLYSSTTNNKNV
ncbi:MAG: RhuM family protein, partial [Bacilli bacterium]